MRSAALWNVMRGLVFVLVIGAAWPVFAGDWQAGAAKVKITPERNLWMAGYASRNRPADGKLTDLWAKALVLEGPEGNRAVLVTLDLIGMDRALSQSVCQALEEEYGLERSQIAICMSHTHTGPVVAKNLRPMHYALLDATQRKWVEDYAAQLVQKIVLVVGRARRQLAPARLSWGSGTATFAVNRRENRAADVPKLRAAGKLHGPSDHDVPVLAVRDAQDRLKAVVFGYACHCTVLSSYQWSGDYAGFAQKELEQAHPDCVALFWAGCGADQNPLPRRTVPLAEHYGRRLATAVDAVLLTSQMRPVKGRLRTRYREIDLPLSTLPSAEQLEQQARSSNRFVAARAKMLLAEIKAGRPLKQSYPYPVQVWKIGDEIQLVILGGEVVVDYALRLKAELGGKRTWVAAYANDVMAYIPSRRVLQEGGYEGATAMVYYGLPTSWSPEVEARIVREVHDQARGAGRTSARPPNILLILLDNLGQDWFGCYGSREGQTPAIDQLARTGLRFRHCYVMPLCSTSRHVLLTGRYPFRTGWCVHHDAAIYGGGYFDWNREITFARVLKAAGYATAIAGKWQINNLFQQPDALSRHGFDEHCVFPEGPRGHPAHTQRYFDPYIIQNGRRLPTRGRFGPQIFTDFLIDFMRRHRRRPFLAFYAMVLAHLPATNTPLNQGQQLTERQKLAGMVRYADHCVERLVDALQTLGLRDKTIVLITSDNGTPAALGGRVEGRVFQAAAGTMLEGDMQEGSIDVPFLANCPALVPGGRVSRALIDSSDVFPTLVELAGAQTPPGVTIDGRSFAAILRGEPDRPSPRQWIFSQYGDKRLVRNQRYKLRSDGRFHDLLNDPLEQHDLSGSSDPQLVAERARLQRVLDALPPNAPLWFTPRSISARRLGIGQPQQRAKDEKSAPEDPIPARSR